jgi:hypothetical protein
LLRGRVRVIAIKQNVDLCPWADMVYGCDGAWWKFRQGLPEFSGPKVVWAGAQLEYPGLLTVQIPGNRSTGFSSDMLFDEIGTVGGGRNSGFQAINLAAQLGPKRILLIGFDMTDRAGVHWYGRNTWAGANNPDAGQMHTWARTLDKAAPELRRRGVEVINCSAISDLTAFPKARLETLDLDRV